MKIIFDSTDEMIAFIKKVCPDDVLPYPKTCNECYTDFDYDPVTCEKCWREECELELKSEESHDYNYNDAIKYIHAHTNLDKDVIDIILKVELDYMRTIGLIEDFEEVKE